MGPPGPLLNTLIVSTSKNQGYPDSDNEVVSTSTHLFLQNKFISITPLFNHSLLIFPGSDCFKEFTNTWIILSLCSFDKSPVNALEFLSRKYCGNDEKPV